MDAPHRLEFVKKTLDECGIKVSEVTAIAYRSELDNNFVYLISLSSPLSESGEALSRATNMPGTTPPRADVLKLIIHLVNPKADGITSVNRVDNMVAAMSLARKAFRGSKWANIVPDVYLWSRPSGTLSDQDASSYVYGWVLSELREGEALDEGMEKMDMKAKEGVIDQFTDILGSLQKIPLPHGVTQYGGLKYSSDGEIVLGEMTIAPGGPFDTLEEHVRAKMILNLKSADGSEIIKGWRGNGLRERLDKFLEDGLGQYLAKHGVDMKQKVFIHADFTTNNALYDPQTNKITTLMDFDFSYIGHPSYEFFSGFHDMGGMLPTGPKDAPRRALIISEFTSSESAVDSAGSASDEEELELQKLFVASLSAKSVPYRPRTIGGIDALADLAWLEYGLYPHSLWHPIVLGRRLARGDHEGVEKERREREENCGVWLSAQGY